MSPSRPLPAASSSGDLPTDALYEVLLRIPAKDLCRLRAVSPAWRALTSDPIFVAAHKSRHHTAPPLLATAYHDHSGVSGVSISDLSGNVVKRIPSTGYEIVMVNKSGDRIGHISSKYDSLCVARTRLDLVCFNWIDYPMAFSVLNPATGATIDLPTGRSKELDHELEVEGIEKWRCQVESCAFGQVSSTREYKALRVFRIDDDRQVCEVITFDDTNHGSWRRKQDPPSHISTSRKMRCVVVDGVVHFLMDFCFSYFKTRSITIEPGCVASFNLETEEWSVLRGPEQVQSFVQDNEDYHYINLELELSVAELDDCLVMVHDIRSTSLNLWFLADSEKGIWVKKYNMLSHVARPRIYPLLTLDDGGIYFSGENYLQGFLSSGESERGFLRSYDPRNDTYSDALKLNDSKSIGIYTGSLLSL